MVWFVSFAFAADTLPRWVSEDKRMSDDDLAKKREGTFVTGLPSFEVDPLTGVGGGLTGYVTSDGDRDDPLFAYTPYRVRVGVAAGLTTRGTAGLTLKVDLPFVGGSAWRLRLDARLERNPNNLYFGLTEDTLAPLPGGSYGAYTDGLAVVRDGGPGEAPRVADVLRHRFLEDEVMVNLKAERVVFGGNWRVLAGYELQHLDYRTFEGEPVTATDPQTGAAVEVPNGRTLLREDAASGAVSGVSGGRVALVQGAFLYDTRDFEPDPRRGSLAELATELSGPFVGSRFTFAKLFFQARQFVPLFPEHVPRLVLAGRFGYGTIFGDDAPFFEFQDQWSAEGSVKALGGSQTLRGYKANRFLGRTVAFTNLELRWRLVDFDVGRQNFTIGVAPLLDLGTVGDRVGLVAPTLRTSTGGGVRVGWNRSTVIVGNVAASPEDVQLSLGFDETF